MKMASIFKNGLVLLAILMFASSAQARGKVIGTAVYSQAVVTAGTSNSQKFPRILASATITIYTPTGTQNLATIYSDSAGTAMGNSFTAGVDGSYAFYTDAPSVDIRVSGITGVPGFTLSEVVVGGSNGSVTPVCAGSNDTALFSSIITSVGSNTSTINLPYIAGSRCAINNLTIPANVTLDNSTGTGIKVNTGQTLTVVGPITAPPRLLFSNATSGLGTVVFTSNNSQKDFQVAWWGANSAAAGAATSAALNAAFVAMGTRHGGTLHLSNVDYVHSGLTIDRWFQTTLIGNDSQDGYIDRTTGPRLIYNGVDGGTAITISNCYACTFKGFASYGSNQDSTSVIGCAKNIYLTMAASGYPPISSQNVFQSLFITADSSGSGAAGRSDYIAVDINNPSGTNNEFHKFRDCKFVGATDVYPNQTGTGIHLGHANVKQIHIEGSSFGSLAKAIDSDSGSFRGNRNSFSADTIIYYGTFADAIYVTGDDSETCVQVLQYDLSVGSGAPFTIVGSRYDALRGADTPSATRTNDPILRYSAQLTVQGSTFGAWESGSSEFNSSFLNGTNPDNVSTVGRLVWENNTADISDRNLNTAFLTFNSVSRNGGFPQKGEGGQLLGGGVGQQNSLQGLMSAPMARDLIGVQQDTDGAGIFLTPAAQNSIAIGESGQIEIAGLARPARPAVTVVGATGATRYLLSIVARDVSGNRTMPSILNQDTTTANATLSVSNYLQITWPKVPGATDYLVLQFSGGAWRSIATVAASGTNVETTNVTANPGGAFTYVIPTYNETVSLKSRGAIVMPVERTFTSLDATPSVIGASDFVTANAGATAITTFDNGVTGQIIRVRVNDANTTFVNGSGILTRTGTNVLATNGLIYQFIRRGSNWYQI